MQKAEYVFAVDHLISNQAVIGYPLPVPDTRVFGQFSTRYPGIIISGYLQSLLSTFAQNFSLIFFYVCCKIFCLQKWLRGRDGRIYKL